MPLVQAMNMAEGAADAARITVARRSSHAAAQDERRGGEPKAADVASERTMCLATQGVAKS